MPTRDVGACGRRDGRQLDGFAGLSCGQPDGQLRCAMPQIAAVPHLWPAARGIGAMPPCGFRAAMPA
jgi:hypothetical protein